MAAIAFESLQTSFLQVHHDLGKSFDDSVRPGSAEEVAALMTEFYELFAKMGYFGESDIARPPHVINKTLARELDISDRAVEMMEMLPYVGRLGDVESPQVHAQFRWSFAAGQGLLGSNFVDYRDDSSLEDRDPFYAVQKENGVPLGYDEWGGKYMLPDYICLSSGTEESNRIWTLSTDFENADPATADVELKPEEDNWLSLERYPSRPASRVLREYIESYRNLDRIPGGPKRGTSLGDKYARLYQEYGWPDNFDVDSFETARVQYDEDCAKKRDSEQPFYDLEYSEHWAKNDEYHITEIHERMAKLEIGTGSKGLSDEERASKKEELLEELNSAIEALAGNRRQMATATLEIEKLDPAVKKAREEEIAEYGS